MEVQNFDYTIITTSFKSQDWLMGPQKCDLCDEVSLYPIWQ